MPDFYTVVTDTGLQALGLASAQGQSFSLTHAVVGDGNGLAVIPNKGMTALVNEVWRGEVAGVKVDSDDSNTFTFEFAIPADVGGFTIREVGLLDESGKLFCIGNFPETGKPVAVNGSVRDLVVRLPLHFENADDVSLVIDTAVAIATKQDVKNGMDALTQRIIDACWTMPAGHIYPVPFPPDELPPHHYVPNGEGLLKTSDAGKTLLSMSAAYKAAHRVIENETHVFMPNVFDENGDGYFPRFVDGGSRSVGSTQGDAIRNITGQMLMQHGETKNDYENGALFATGESLSGATGTSTILRSGLGLDVSRIVPTSHENRPKNYGFIPAIYLPPLGV
ncbi:phage tail protein [Halodesulfovibrio aestuarii]|uniref:Phage tail-collar fibre protein n=1 Tax=Halodesulfovibrio aestuarii TaxID=126333 RepID=A0A8G2C8I6_9BACT|nr:phage tail protein [Halodesulfovibrio aestuarii]SHI82202.1 Phage tail-collar fibre protein [Halodesulfovibrio aestuarii]